MCHLCIIKKLFIGVHLLCSEQDADQDDEPIRSLCWLSTTTMPTNAKSAQQEQVGPVMETVLVAADDIAIGEPVTPDSVEAREVQVDAVIQIPLRDPSQVQGQPAIFNIPAGTQVTQAAVGLGVGAENLAAQLQTGEKAVSFIVDRTQGLNFLVQPGDTIDVLVAIHLSDPKSPGIIRTVKTVSRTSASCT